MKLMMGLRALIGIFVLICITQVQAAARRITSPTACREHADKLLKEVTTVYQKRQFKTDKTRHDFEMKLFRKFDQMLKAMADLGEGTPLRERIQKLQTECDDASLAQLNIAQLVLITQKISKAMREFEKEAGPEISAKVSRVTRSQGGVYEDEAGSDSDSEESLSDSEAACEARAKLAEVLLQLPQFMDITESSDLPKARFVMLKALAEEALTHIDQLCENDASLEDEQCDALRAIHKEIFKRLGSKRTLSAQATAKVAVFIVQGLLQVAGALAIQVNKLSLADRPDLVAQRVSYRKWGIRTIVTAMTLSAVLVAGNAAGWIDIQIIPSVTEILAALPNIL